jgi:hypothetical protein
MLNNLVVGEGGYSYLYSKIEKKLKEWFWWTTFSEGPHKLIEALRTL